MLITPATNDSVIIIFEAKNTHKSIDGDIKEFLNTLIDHQIRIQLDKANGRIRDLIVAHAFSPFDLKKVIDSK
jgi:His-Xaa-Ser system protein HxsD